MASTVISRIAAPIRPGDLLDPTDVSQSPLGEASTKPSGAHLELNSLLKKRKTPRTQEKKKIPKTQKIPISNGPRETNKEEIIKLYLSSSGSDELLGHTFRMFSGLYPFQAVH